MSLQLAAGTAVVGRKDAQGQEKVIELDALRERVDELVTLYDSSKQAKGAYGDAVKAVAEKAGLQAGVVRKFIAARANEKSEQEKRNADQLSLCFEEIGG